MRNVLRISGRLLCAVVLSACAGAFASASAADRDDRVISARAGGVNFVSGDVTVKRAGKADWETLTAEDELKAGDAVRTGADGRAEVLLNPGSYLRLGENAEFELTSPKLDDLRLRLARGSAVIEATGYGKFDLLIVVLTPTAETKIVRTGVYRVNVLASETEVLVSKGLALVGATEVKEGRAARVGASGAAVVAKFDKKLRDALDLWSRRRGEELAKANQRLRVRNAAGLLANVRFDDAFYRGGQVFGLWIRTHRPDCNFTFVPLAYGWSSPYGFFYESWLMLPGNCFRRSCGANIDRLAQMRWRIFQQQNGVVHHGTGSGSGSNSSTGTGSGSGSSGDFSGGSSGSGSTIIRDTTPAEARQPGSRGDFSGGRTTPPNTGGDGVRGGKTRDH
jgi:uncharacterized membrane protein YgcG